MKSHCAMAVAIATAALLAPPASAVPLVMTDGSSLIKTDSSSLSSITTTPVTGLQGGEVLVGIDQRPATGELFGIGSTSRMYLLDPITGAVTQVGSPGSFALNGTVFGIDFNPVPDRIREVSDTEQNLRLNPNDGTLAVIDSALNPAGKVVAAAYTNNFAGATTTTLFDIDSASGKLMRQGSVNGTPDSPNGGLLTEVGSLVLGTNLNDAIGFDIGADGVAFATIFVGGVSRLYGINTSTGAATNLGTIGAGATPYLGLAIMPARLRLTSATVNAVEGGTAIFQVTRNTPAAATGTVTVDYSTAAGTATSGDDFTPVTGTVRWGPGESGAKTIAVPVPADAGAEGAETFTVTLANVTGADAVLGTQTTSTATIAANGAAAPASPAPGPAYVANGSVSAVLIDDTGRTYLGGLFTRMGPRTGRAIKLTSSDDQAASGFPDVNGSVFATVADGSGGWFIGGDFSAVGGVARTRLAHVLGDGSLDATWNPGANDSVRALALSGTDLYAGGLFTTAGGQSRSKIAKLSATGTGAADTTWDPGVTGTSVNALAESGTDLFVGGTFTAAGGRLRSNIAKVATTGTGAADATWNPSANGQVRALGVSGTDLFVGGTFNGANSIGGQARNRLAKLATTGAGNADATWDPSPTLSSISSLIVSGSDLYVGGFFDSIGGQARNDIARLSTTGAGNADGWNPVGDSSVFSMALSGTDLYVGGGFTTMGGQARRKLAKLSTTTGAADPAWDPNPSDDVNALAVSGSALYAGGAFNSAGAQNVQRMRLARLNADGTLDLDWNPGADGQVRALALSGADLFVGGGFTTVGGLARNLIAKLSTTGTGAADPAWDPNANGVINALVASGTDLFVGGNFSGANSIGGQTRNGIAKLSTTGAGAADPAWNPNANSAVIALALSGADLYAGGEFFGPNSIGGQARNYIAKLSTTGSGAADATWDPNANSSVYALALSGSDLYAGGVFNGASSIGGQARNYIAKLATTGTGAADPTWDPNANTQVLALALLGTDLYAGGDFTSVGGQARNRVAKLSTTGPGAADTAWNFDASGSVVAIAASGPRLAVGGAFMRMGGFSTQGIAMLLPPPDPPSPPAPPDGGTPGGTATPAPVNTALPLIAGTATQGRTLSVTDGTWANSPTSFLRQWLRCDGGGANCTSIAGATASSYVLGAADVGHRLRAVIVATNAGGSAAATSATTAAIAAPRPVVSRASLVASEFRAKDGTKLTLTLSRAATVEVVIRKRVRGRKVAGKCKRKAKKGKRCHLNVRKAKRTFTGVAGKNSFRLRLSKLEPGRYTARITARDAAGVASKPVTLKFTIER